MKNWGMLSLAAPPPPSSLHAPASPDADHRILVYHVVYRSVLSTLLHLSPASLKRSDMDMRS